MFFHEFANQKVKKSQVYTPTIHNGASPLLSSQRFCLSAWDFFKQPKEVQEPLGAALFTVRLSPPGTVRSGISGAAGGGFVLRI